MTTDWSNPFSAMEPKYLAAMRAAQEFLHKHSPAQLLERVGQVIGELPPAPPVSKAHLQKSYAAAPAADDFLAGLGAFYLTEARMLVLDTTAGHYQMTFGYNDPGLLAAAETATKAGVVWDNHSNIPQAPVKLLAKKLAQTAGAPLETALMGCCTGSVACAAALKIQLLWYQKRHPGGKAPVIVVLAGNYHGTDMIAQHLRGMWPDYVTGLVVETVEPNDYESLQYVFDKHGDAVAGFWAEPILMNREAIVVEPAFLQLARRLCDESGALMVIDEIQTGFWQPEVFAFRTLGIAPDMVVAGKGMTAGLHPQSALVFRRDLDVLAQYDAISTNGSAALPCCIALCCIARIESQANRIAAIGDRYAAGLGALAGEFPALLQDARGKRHIGALKFHRDTDALAFHRRAVESGLWIRAHAYHPGHSAVLSKLPLVADEPIVDFLLERLRALLREMTA